MTVVASLPQANRNAGTYTVPGTDGIDIRPFRQQPNDAIQARAVMQVADLRDATLAIPLRVEQAFDVDAGAHPIWSPVPISEYTWQGGRVTNRNGQLVDPDPPTVWYTNSASWPVAVRILLTLPSRLNIGLTLEVLAQG